MEVSLGNGQCSHFSRTGCLEHGGARFQRCASCPHVIDQDDRSAFEPLSAPTGREKRRESEGAIEVPAPRSRIKPSLRCRGAHAPEDAAHRHTQVPRQLFSLVEASPCATPRMEGYRHHPVCALQHMSAGLDHERRQGTGQAPPPIVFECVEDRSQGPFIVPSGSRGVDRAWGAATAGTLLERRADDAPRGEGITARAAERRDQDPDLAPTLVANGSDKRCVEHSIARRASWCDRDGEECVYDSPAMGKRSAFPQRRSRS